MPSHKTAVNAKSKYGMTNVFLRLSAPPLLFSPAVVLTCTLFPNCVSLGNPSSVYILSFFHFSRCLTFPWAPVVVPYFCSYVCPHVLMFLMCVFGFKFHVPSLSLSYFELFGSTIIKGLFLVIAFLISDTPHSPNHSFSCVLSWVIKRSVFCN